MTPHALDGRVYELPEDLSKPCCVLIVAFRREQQQLVDGWLPWLIELERNRPYLSVYELPVLSARYGPVRWFIDGGMTRGIPDPAARARTITVYTDVQQVVENLGLSGTATIAVLMVESTGRILARETGGFDHHKAERLSQTVTSMAPQGKSARRSRTAPVT